MKFDDIPRPRVEVMARHVHRMVGYFTRLTQRMDAVRVPHDDPIRAKVKEAAARVFELWVDLHYRSCYGSPHPDDKSKSAPPKPPPRGPGV